MYHTGPWDATGVDHTGTDATNTWKGPTSGMWDTTSGSSGNWSNNGTGQAFTWVNQELQAVFDNTGNNRSITLGGTVIAHGLTFNTGATGYSFTGGSLTVTVGGIAANENVTINSHVYIGGPQSWTVASGKTLTVNGPLHTVISDLTINGSGNTIISGPIDGGGYINIYGGAKPGGLIQAGSGSLTLAGSAFNFTGDITANSGNLVFSPPSGTSVSYSGGLFGSAPITVNTSRHRLTRRPGVEFHRHFFSAIRGHAQFHPGRRRHKHILQSNHQQQRRRFDHPRRSRQNHSYRLQCLYRLHHDHRRRSSSEHRRWNTFRKPSRSQRRRISKQRLLHLHSRPRHKRWSSPMGGERRRFFRRRRGTDRQHLWRQPHSELGKQRRKSNRRVTRFRLRNGRLCDDLHQRHQSG